MYIHLILINRETKYCTMKIFFRVCNRTHFSNIDGVIILNYLKYLKHLYPHLIQTGVPIEIRSGLKIYFLPRLKS